MDDTNKQKAERLEKDNDWQGALNIYCELIQNQPNDVECLSKIGWCQSRLQRYDESIITFSKVIEIEPKKAKWYYMVGYQYYCKQEWQQAIDYFRKALDLYPNYFIVKYRLGYALTKVCGTLYKLRKPEYFEAFKQFEECNLLWNNMTEEQKKQNKSTYGDVCFQQGKIFLEREDWEKAINSFKKAYEMNPYSVEVRYEYSKALVKNGQPQEAQKILPNDDNKYYIKELRADIYQKLGDFDSALKILFSCIEKRNRDYLLRQIADIYYDKGDFLTAYKYIVRALQIKNENHKNHLSLARIYSALGLYNKAKNEAEFAIKLKNSKYDTDYNEARKLLENIILKITENNHGFDDKFLLKQLTHYETEKRKGKIKNFNFQKGYGFVESKGESIFLHISSVPKHMQTMIKEGVNISFRLESTPKGLAAKDVIVENNG